MKKFFKFKKNVIWQTAKYFKLGVDSVQQILRILPNFSPYQIFFDEGRSSKFYFYHYDNFNFVMSILIKSRAH